MPVYRALLNRHLPKDYSRYKNVASNTNVRSDAQKHLMMESACLRGSSSL